MRSVTTPTVPVGVVLRHARERAGLSARELCARIGALASYVTKVENGDIDPTLSTFSRMAVTLGLNVHEVYFLIVQAAFKETQMSHPGDKVEG